MSVPRQTGVLRVLYRFNALLLLVPLWFFYRMLAPEFPTAWPERRVGPFVAVPTPADADPPYRVDGDYMKDFSVRFCADCVKRIRLARSNVGDRPTDLTDDPAGILHGAGPLLYAHVPFPERITESDRLWVTVQEWNGRTHYFSWPLRGLATLDRE